MRYTAVGSAIGRCLGLRVGMGVVGIGGLLVALLLQNAYSPSAAGTRSSPPARLVLSASIQPDAAVAVRVRSNAPTVRLRFLRVTDWHRRTMIMRSGRATRRLPAGTTLIRAVTGRGPSVAGRARAIVVPTRTPAIPGPAVPPLGTTPTATPSPTPPGEAEAVDASPAPMLAPTPTPVPTPNQPEPEAVVSVDTSADRHPIDPRIYGLNIADSNTLQDLRIPLDRFGGNTTTRYNWRANAANHAMDWFFESLPEAGGSSPGAWVDSILASDASAGAESMVTIPMAGYVARLGAGRSKLASYSIAKYGPQTASDFQWFPDAGNGVREDGTSIITNDPTDANVTADSTFQADWVAHIVGEHGPAGYRPGQRRYYLYDNEPSIWFETHRDIHPVGTTRQEYLDKIIDYGTRIRAADPAAVLVGPEEFGWAGLLHSGYDLQWGRDHGWGVLPDRAAHGNTDQFPWLLAQLNAHHRVTGVRLLDVATTHWYPQSGEFSDDVTRHMQSLRNRSTRSLWDPDYNDESWIGEPVALIPRLKDWVSTEYPGTEVGITEYSWGADTHMSGAIAQADVLGIFGREGLDLANRWTTPQPGTAVYRAFRLYRNYDGAGSGFGSVSVRASVADSDHLAAFAAQRPDATTTVMLLNKDLDDSTTTRVELSSSPATAAQVWTLAGGSIRRSDDVVVRQGSVQLQLPAQSATLLVLPG